MAHACVNGSGQTPPLRIRFDTRVVDACLRLFRSGIAASIELSALARLPLVRGGMASRCNDPPAD